MIRLHKSSHQITDELSNKGIIIGRDALADMDVGYLEITLPYALHIATLPWL